MTVNKKMPRESFAIVGSLVDSLPDKSLRAESNAFVIVNALGKIVCRDFNVGNTLNEALEKYSVPSDGILHLDPEEFLMPGLIDSHTHASQFPNAGLGLDLPLLKWLEKYTFPMETQFADPEYASVAYRRVVDATLSSGTTCAAYYATIHSKATEILCDIAEDKGQRALVGKVSMNRNCPEDLSETTHASLSATEAFVASTLSRQSELVQPVVTPRFAVACDKELLVGLGDIAKKYQTRIQTHLAETLPEIEFVRELEPASLNYTDVYRQSGLLTPRTIFGHCIHLTKDEMDLLRDNGSGISHCPNSNCSIRSGNLNVRKMQSHGIKVGLGTDCSAGFSVSMIDAMRQAICVSNQLHIVNNSCQPLSYADVLHLATRGSAEVTDLADQVGSLDVGLHFDAIRIRLNSRGNLQSRLFGHESLDDLVHKFVFLGDDRNVVQAWVNGRKVKDTL